ncbi:MAG: uroporphyrinogen III methyltransferase [Gammaproteobacteria bacterium]|nr:MAG: uroporphyrinogen III methyltransferase [Gammaproteobacteria bacterium]
MTTVVLTRPQADSERLSEALQNEGFQTRVMPIVTIEAIPTAEQAPAPSVSDDALCIFISANAVRFGLPQLGSALARDPDLTVIAVGNKTRDTLAAEGIQAQVPVRADSEGLLAMPALSAPDSRDVVIVKGEGGRELLASELTGRGARVTEWACYRRCWPEVDVSGLIEISAGLIFQASSGEMVSRLSELLAGGGQADLFQSSIIVPSDRVARLATEIGWGQVIRAEDASDDAFIAR